VLSLRDNIRNIKSLSDDIDMPGKTPNIYRGSASTIDLTKYFDSTLIPNLRLVHAGG
jgi:hypothetical protein